MSIKQAIEQGVKDFRKQRGKMTIAVVPTWEIDTVSTAAVAGNSEAQEQLRSIAHWTAAADTAEREGVHPGCIYCGSAICKSDEPGQGDVSAWVIITPHEDEDGTGMVMPVCFRCVEHGPDEIARKAIAELEREAGVDVHLLQ